MPIIALSHYMFNQERSFLLVLSKEGTQDVEKGENNSSRNKKREKVNIKI